MLLRIGLVLFVMLALVACSSDEGEARAQCRREIQTLLREPSSATVIMRSSVLVGDRDFKLQFEVRGLNAFGATVTEHYECVIEFTDPDGDVSNGYSYNIVAYPAR
jgi:hypothetical protein